MRMQLVGLGILLGAVSLANVARAEHGRPSRAALEAMGLGSMTVMSDEEAMSVRGQGYQGGGSKGIQSYVRVTGSSFATYDGGGGSGSHSENSYFAEGNHKAKGSNSSYAGVADIWVGSGGHKPGGNGGGGYGKPRGSNGGGYGGGGYGGGQPSVKIHTTVFFAGGHSTANAW
jgi:hypothetical protein